MDVKIKNQDISLKNNGQIEVISGKEEYLQRAYISLASKRGAFCYKRDLGAYCDLKNIKDTEKIRKEAEAAICFMPELEIIKAEIKGNNIVFNINTPFGQGEITI